VKLPIYFDYHATTPVDPRVLEAMMPYFTTQFGNAASRAHAYGWEAEDAVEKSRAAVAKAIGANSREVIFTSGATESINIALKGCNEPGPCKKGEILTLAVEHKATLDSANYLQKNGFTAKYLPVDAEGMIDPDTIEQAITPSTLIVSVMHANNEIGTIYPIAEIGKRVRERGILFHVDAAQSFGKIPIDVNAMNIDLLSISAHKIYGPKGAGALYVRGQNPRVKVCAFVHGGGHERGLRSGTLNVPGIVGLAKAAEIAVAVMTEESDRVGRLRDRLQRGLFEGLGPLKLNGSPAHRLANNLNLSFSGIEGLALLQSIRELAVSTGSACSSGAGSHVLAAIGLSDELAQATLRFGLGRYTTEAEVDFAVKTVTSAVRRLRDGLPPQGSSAS